MAGADRDPKVFLRVYGVVMGGVWVVLGVFLLVLAVVRLVQGQIRDAAFASIFAIAFFAVAALSHRWHQRMLTRKPRWARDLSPEVLDDPERRLDAFRHTRQARALPWIFLLIGIGGVVWALAVGEWVALIASVVVLIGGVRLLQRIYLPGAEQ